MESQKEPPVTKRCQEPLLKPLFISSFPGRPRPRNVAPKFHCATVCLTHTGLPKHPALIRPVVQVIDHKRSAVIFSARTYFIR